MKQKNNTPISAKLDELKLRISEVFVLSDYGALTGLPDRLKILGHHSTALALEQILEGEVRSRLPEIPKENEEEI